MFFAWGDKFDAKSFLAEHCLSWKSGYCNQGFYPDDPRMHNSVLYCPDEYANMSTKHQIEWATRFFVQFHNSLNELKAWGVRMRLDVANSNTINLANPENVYESILFDESFLAAVLPFISVLHLSVNVEAINFNELRVSEERGL